MTRYLLDTNIVSYYLRRSSPALEARLEEELKHRRCAVSVLTRAELRFGQAGMLASDRRQSLINNFLLQLPNLEWTSKAADQYGELKGHLKRSGTPSGEMETQIAAHALADDLILVTHNTRHFVRIAEFTDLKIENWMAP
jgi:tRNA(fMet)-specific endonuclease VapC